GTLGLNFFAPFKVAADWHHERIYVSPREDTLASLRLRLSRWGDKLPTCEHAGCVTLAMAGSALRVSSDPQLDRSMEVVVRVKAKTADPLPLVYLSLAAGSTPFELTLDARYTDGEAEVVDADPFPRECPHPP